MQEFVIETHALSRNFSGVCALDSVSLRVPRGAVLALLGHNGAGKTTLVNVLSTLLPPTSGVARVAGFDVTRQGRQVRGRIGLTGQFATLDEQLSGKDNVCLVARLLGARRTEARARARDLLEQFGLSAAADRPARTYSGGMRRRLDLAISLAGRPEVLFLDEPSTGLDPESRMWLWEIVGGLVSDGTTVLLTTQYLEEADRLADSVVVLSRGQVGAAGTPAELKARVGERAIHVTVPGDDLERTVRALHMAGLEPESDIGRHSVSARVARSDDTVRVIRALDNAGIEASEVKVAEPTLDDVYLAITRRTVTAIP